MAKYAGIDISYCQPNVDYAAVKAGKMGTLAIKYVMVRAAYGCREDTHFRKHVDGCLKAGLNVGLYLYSTATTAAQAKKEAEFVISLIKKYGYDGKIAYPIAYDLEEESQAKLGSKTCTSLCKAFCDTIKSYNYYPMIYTNVNWLCMSKYIDYNALQNYDFWIAGYISEANMVRWGAMEKATMWQHSVAGNSSFDVQKIKAIPGIKGECDCNWAYVGLAAKIKKLGMNKFPVPKTTYTVTAVKKDLEKDEAKALMTSLKADGFTVTYTSVTK